MLYRKYHVLANETETVGYFALENVAISEAEALAKVNEWNRLSAVTNGSQYTYWLEPSDAE